MRALLLAVVLSLGAGLAGAAVHVVKPDGTGDYPTIQTAIDHAVAGDTVLLKPGTYRGTGNRAIHLRGLDLVIRGEAGIEATVIDPQNLDRAFDIGEGEGPGAILEDLWIRRARVYGLGAGGGIRVNGAAPTLRSLRFDDCGSEANGGAIALESSGASLQSIGIWGCASDQDGAGIWIQGSQVVAADLDIHDCGADRDGGAIAIDQSTLTLEGALLYGNVADHWGSGIHASRSTLVAGGVTCADNSAVVGAIFLWEQVNASLSRCLVAFNQGIGGFWREPTATVALDCCIVYGNEGGNFVGFLSDPIGTNGNLNADPFFCGLSAGDFTLDSLSPCLPAGNSCGVLIGRLGQGCALPHVSISGTAYDAHGGVLAGVAIAGHGDAPQLTDSLGRFAFDLIAGWSGTLTPSLEGYEFTPPERVYSIVVDDQPAQDFVGLHGTGLYVPSVYPTIAAALAAAFPGDTVFVAPGTYSGLGNRDLELPAFPLVLRGTGGSLLTTIDCDDWERAFIIDAGQTQATVVEGFTIFDGRANDYGGGIYILGAAPTLRDLRFVSCRATNAGGAIFIRQSTGALLEDIVIENSSASTSGGAGIGLRQSSVAISGLLMSSNHSYRLACGLESEDSQLSLDGATFVDNSCTEEGAVIALAGGSATLSRCLVAYNAGDGGIAGSEGAQLAITCSNLWQNQGGNFTGELGDPTGQDGNTAVDPRFCDLGSGDWQLHADSPCLPAGNACGVLIGALVEGCTTALHRIAGAVRDAQGIGIGGADITGLVVPLETAADGQYGVWLPAGWSGALAPAHPHMHFIPEASSYVDLQADLLAEDYLAVNPTHFQFPTDFANLQEAVNFCDDGDTLLVLPGVYDLPLDPDYNPGLLIGDKALVMISLSGPQATILQNGSTGILMGAEDATVIRGFTIRHCGMAISCEGIGAPRLEELILEDNGTFYNSDPGWGAALLCWGSSPRLSNVIIRNNEAEPTWSIDSGRGGAVYCLGGAPQFMTCRFESNAAVEGGALYLAGASPTFIATHFVGNRAKAYESYGERWTYDAYGGAVYCYGGAPSFLYCSFDGNEARIVDEPGDAYGGAFYLTGGAAPSFLNCSFAGNGAIAPGHEALGGAFYLSANTAPVIANSIVAFGTGGGGFYSPNGTRALAMSCSDVFGNAGGEFLGLPDPTGSEGNISADPHFCDRESGDLQLAANSPCLPSHNACGVQMGAWDQGCVATSAPADAAPVALLLAPNCPNPFNPSTTIRFGLPRASAVDLSVYDAAGRRVATLIAGESLPPGYHEVEWRGRDDEGRGLASGVYFLQLEAGAESRSRKLILLK